MHIPEGITTFPEMVEAVTEEQKLRERIRDLQPAFCYKPKDIANHDHNVKVKSDKARKVAKAARKKNRPTKKKAKKGKKK